MGFLTLLKLKSVLQFVVKNWQYILLLAILASGFFYWQSLKHQISDLELKLEAKQNEIAALQLQVQTCEANFKGLVGSLEAQNDALGKIDETIKKSQQDWKKLANTITTSNAVLDRRLREILNDKKPESCEEAIRYLLDARKGYPK